MRTLSRERLLYAGLTFLIVFVLLQTLSRRFVARFPQGEKALGLEAE